jgi:hypothetical protein
MSLNIAILQGSSDSPMWKRGKYSFSRTNTRLPARARNVAALLPPGPHPITKASYLSCFIANKFEDVVCDGKLGNMRIMPMPLAG